MLIFADGLRALCTTSKATHLQEYKVITWSKSRSRLSHGVDNVEAGAAYEYMTRKARGTD